MIINRTINRIKSIVSGCQATDYKHVTYILPTIYPTMLPTIITFCSLYNDEYYNDTGNEYYHLICNISSNICQHDHDHVK